MGRNIPQKTLIDIIKYPILTDKTTRLIEENRYCFAVEVKANKPQIKEAIEKLFDVHIKKIGTLYVKKKSKRVGKYIGKKSEYKKAIIKLRDNERIKLFSEN
uniref:Large ribosomal subunit protein uL23c n=1 Tax=Melanthalia intermedia TaxID=172989 RepID=A0A345UAV0_9FLOR|nr:ribosomal protein L23 [Melanthalia intermedia]AXI97586.1 ribosomal protein L23 [Melanthalia intermedia]